MADKKLAIIATKGTLDWAYPPFILSSTVRPFITVLKFTYLVHVTKLLKEKRQSRQFLLNTFFS